MTTDENTQQKILKAALAEFSLKGFGGARMETIAKNAGVNKAMIFYYFSSKKELYKIIVQQAFTSIAPQIIQLMSKNPTAEEFLETAPKIYITFLADNQDYFRMIGMELLQNAENIASTVKFILEDNSDSPLPQRLRSIIGKWYEEGQISEPDPMQFMINVISLSILFFIARPMIQLLFGEPEDKDFFEKRVTSVVNVLKNGMLT
jgi:AcrR family transcriptional regulator